MKVLVIPDVHLKPWMFTKAEKLMKKGIAQQVICLMDIPDDWGETFNLELYAQTFDATINFAKAFPETLWCYGNHDVCYLWNQRETGYSKVAPRLVNEKLQMLEKCLPDKRQLAFIHRIDDVLFMHGGLTEEFVNTYIPEDKRKDPDQTIALINTFGMTQLWYNYSPIWYRPQYNNKPMYEVDRFLQVVGHSPVEEIRKDGSVLSCDVFSTYRDKKPIGTQEFLIVDTKTWEFHGIKN